MLTCFLTLTTVNLAVSALSQHIVQARQLLDVGAKRWCSRCPESSVLRRLLFGLWSLFCCLLRRLLPLGKEVELQVTYNKGRVCIGEGNDHLERDEEEWRGGGLYPASASGICFISLGRAQRVGTSFHDERSKRLSQYSREI